MQRKLWAILLACWMALYGLLAVTNLTIYGSGVLLGFLALATAVLLALDR